MEYDLKRQIIAAARERADMISDEKGREYTQTGDEYQKSGDILANFKRNAERFGVSPITVLGVYMGKHFDSIENFIQEIVTKTSYEDAVELVFSGEGIISRIDDARNYLDLMECLLFEYQLHPFSVNAEALAPAEVAEENEQLSLDGEAEEPEAEQTLEEFVEESMNAELADLSDLTPSPFQGSREVGNG